MPVDLSTPEGPAALIEQAVSRFGGVDVLVNNVGMAKGAGLVDTPDAAWQEALDYTLYPAVRASRAAVPHMIRRGGGSIVLIASIYGREAGGRLTYNVVKAAEISLGKALARELAPKNIRVNTIAPGLDPLPGRLVAPAAAGRPGRHRRLRRPRAPVRALRARRGSRRRGGLAGLAARQLGQWRLHPRRRLPGTIEHLTGRHGASPPIR